MLDDSRHLILCHPFASSAEHRAALVQALGRCHDFAAPDNTITSLETSRNPNVALAARLSILLRVYSGDYHTDSFESDRLSARIRAGDEAIWFWGSADEVARLRGMLQGGPQKGLESLKLGTVTVISAEKQFGPGHGELCRSGSTDTSLGARGPIVFRTLTYVDGREEYLCGRYHTLTLASRNRPSTACAPGGEAIQRLHANYARSQFWGFAPWFVMQGGMLEQLDFRESNRAPQEVLTAIQSATTWWLPGPREAEYVEALSRLNFGISPTIAVDLGEPEPAVGELLYLPPKQIRAYNAAFVGVESGSQERTLDRVVKELLDVRPCCIVARVQIDEPRTAALQTHLLRLGFQLNAILPPKRAIINTRPISLPTYALWCKGRTDLRVAPPFYAKATPTTTDEATVLSYRRDVLN